MHHPSSSTADARSHNQYRVLFIGWPNATAQRLAEQLHQDQIELSSMPLSDVGDRLADLSPLPPVIFIRVCSDQDLDEHILNTLKSRRVRSRANLFAYTGDCAQGGHPLSRNTSLFEHVIDDHLEPDQFVPMVKTIINNAAHLRKLQADVERRSSAIGAIQSGVFHVQTLRHATNLSTMLSLACPDPSAAALGLYELIANAIEHGNLAIGYDQKTQLLEKQAYETELNRRLQLPEYKDKKVIVTFVRHDDHISITIQDEGKGFDPASYMTFDPSRMLHTHGRGIAMAVASSMDDIQYSEQGNEVSCRINLPR